MFLTQNHYDGCRIHRNVDWVRDAARAAVAVAPEKILTKQHKPLIAKWPVAQEHVSRGNQGRRPPSRQQGHTRLQKPCWISPSHLRNAVHLKQKQTPQINTRKHLKVHLPLTDPKGQAILTHLTQVGLTPLKHTCWRTEPLNTRTQVRRIETCVLFTKICFDYGQ